MQGRLDEAERVGNEVLAAYVSQGDLRHAGNVEIYLARVALRRGDAATALDLTRSAVERVRSMPALLAYALGALSCAERVGGSASDALGRAREACEILERVKVIEEGEGFVRLAWAEALEASGDREAAKGAIAAARDRLLEQTEEIGDPEVRRTFLECVPEHARTLELARAWLAEA